MKFTLPFEGTGGPVYAAGGEEVVEEDIEEAWVVDLVVGSVVGELEELEVDVLIFEVGEIDVATGVDTEEITDDVALVGRDVDDPLAEALVDVEEITDDFALVGRDVDDPLTKTLVDVEEITDDVALVGRDVDDPLAEVLVVRLTVEVTDAEDDIAVDVGMALYNSSRVPAPQNSKALPGQGKSQSD